MILRLYDYRTRRYVTFGRYEEGHVFRLTDLLPEGQVLESLELTPDAPSRNICRLHGTKNKAVLYRKVVLAFLSLVIDDLIATGNTYRLPTSGKAKWRVVAKSREEVNAIAARDTYKFVDLDKSQGRIYELVMQYWAHGEYKRRVLRIDYSRYQHLCALVNAGQVYSIS